VLLTKTRGEAIREEGRKPTGSESRHSGCIEWPEGTSRRKCKRERRESDQEKKKSQNDIMHTNAAVNEPFRVFYTCQISEAESCIAKAYRTCFPEGCVKNGSELLK